MNKFERKIGSVGQIGPDIDYGRPYSFNVDGNFNLVPLAETGACFWAVHLVKGIIYPDNLQERNVIIDYANEQGLNDNLGYDLHGDFGLKVGRGNVMRVVNKLKKGFSADSRVIG